MAVSKDWMAVKSVCHSGIILFGKMEPLQRPHLDVPSDPVKSVSSAISYSGRMTDLIVYAGAGRTSRLIGASQSRSDCMRNLAASR